MTVPVTIRKIQVGEGIPKICTPITGRTAVQIREQAKRTVQASPDLVEWRVDYFDMVDNEESVKQMITEIREILEEIPLLFTFRTSQEGGERSITEEAYKRLNSAAAGLTDLVDIELYFCGEQTKSLIEEIQKQGSRVICSNHHFTETPPCEALTEILKKMEQAGADILKVAVMPKDPGDVLELLRATWEMKKKTDRPLITMAMGGQGVVSRISGEIFGSSVTFGTVGDASAPGQLPSDELRDILSLLHEKI